MEYNYSQLFTAEQIEKIAKSIDFESERSNGKMTHEIMRRGCDDLKSDIDCLVLRSRMVESIYKYPRKPVAKTPEEITKEMTAECRELVKHALLVAVCVQEFYMEVVE